MKKAGQQSSIMNFMSPGSNQDKQVSFEDDVDQKWRSKRTAGISPGPHGAGLEFTPKRKTPKGEKGALEQEGSSTQHQDELQGSDEDKVIPKQPEPDHSKEDYDENEFPHEREEKWKILAAEFEKEQDKALNEEPNSMKLIGLKTWRDVKKSLRLYKRSIQLV